MVLTLSVCGFVGATALLIYVLFGYPLLLAAVARVKRRPVARGPYVPTVSIVVAVRNGAEFIEQKLRSILDLEFPRERMEIIVASDGSTDATNDIVGQFSSEGVRLLSLQRGGKPAALNAAIRQASGEILVLTDVRQVLAPDSLALLLENFADPQVGAASGELVILSGNSSQEKNTGLYWRYEVWIRLRLSEVDSIFGATGAYYSLRRSLAVDIPVNSLLDDMYLPLAAFFRGYRLIVDTRARMFDRPTALRSEFRRKVRTLAGNYQILREYPALLSWRNRMWLHFVSYKFGRLLLPFAMLTVLVCSFGLPRPWSIWSLAAQAVFYAIAMIDIWTPEGVLKKITSPVQTFVVLMAATLCAVSIFFVPSARLWTPPEKT